MDNNRPLIGIMASYLHPWPLFEHTERFNLMVFTVSGMNWSKKIVTGLILENGIWQEKSLSFPSIIYNRLYVSNYALASSIEAVIGVGRVFNCITRFDKWMIYEIIRKSKAKEFLPETCLFHKINLLELIKRGKVLILKPCKGSMGNDVYRIELINDSVYQLYQHTNFPVFTTKDASKFINHIKKRINNKFIVQEFIDIAKINDKIYDVRILVQKNNIGQWTVPGGLSRVSYANYYITNICSEIISLDTLVENRVLSSGALDLIYTISLEVAKTLERQLGHLGDICVDFGFDNQGKPWLIEVNGKTQKSLVYRLEDESLIRATFINPIEYAYFLATRL
jgi:hypothetical protein